MTSIGTNLERFSSALNAYPAGFSGNRLNLLLVDNAEPIKSANAYLHQLDDLILLEERREYLIDEYSSWPFPRIKLDEVPDPWLLSLRLFENFNEAQRFMPTQSSVGNLLQERVRQSQPTVVILVIVDGLSYYDLLNYDNVTPCLVNGLSTTQYGYRTVVGNPSISRKMFMLGYFQQMAFTYYALENDELSADIHDTFSDTQVTKVREFDEVIRKVKSTNFTRGYIQVVLSGLDQLSHAHRDRPPRDYYLKEILSRFEQLVDCASTKGQKVVACLTADHGILWREIIEDKIEITANTRTDDFYHPRYIKGSILRPYGHNCRSLNQNFTLLKIPWMTRNFKSNEWGVHGGISAWESIVPLIFHTT